MGRHVADIWAAFSVSAARFDAAEAVLRAISVTRESAGLVLLGGHGSSTVNNPHAAGLDCGACGGHTPESNARVAAVLNDPLVRVGLARRGIAIPPDTWFVAALHDTSTDAVRLFDAGAVPPSQAANLDHLYGWLEQASTRTRALRAGGLGLATSADPMPAILSRARDWYEVRPEWALASNASFIPAPPALTRGLELGGRAFLHSYDWRADAGFGVLELIITPPIVAQAGSTCISTDRPWTTRPGAPGTRCCTTSPGASGCWGAMVATCA